MNAVRESPVSPSGKTLEPRAPDDAITRMPCGLRLEHHRPARGEA